MFDSVWVNCPICKKINEFQTKSGECILNNYSLKNCPKIVLEDINRHSPYHCECGAIYEINIKYRKTRLLNWDKLQLKLNKMNREIKFRAYNGERMDYNN